MRASQLLAPALATLLLACGGAGEDQGAPQPAMADCRLCDHLSACTNQALAICAATCKLFVLEPACAQALGAASCEDTVKPPPALSAACAAPACGTDSAACNADGTLSLCTTGLSSRRYCSGACEAGGLSYTGTCAVAYHGRASTTGAAVCWCE